MGNRPTNKGERPYHHGDLRAALLVEAERILKKDGVQCLTLRAAARAVGVSHTAPKNHFSDLTGLLSELAAVGYNRFSQVLMAAMETDSHERPRAAARAYVRFAREHPNLFLLMFCGERLDHSNPALQDAIAGARVALRAAAPLATANARMEPLRAAAEETARWSLVHGFAMLLLDGRLNHTLGLLPADETVDTLFEAMLGAAHVG